MVFYFNSQSVFTGIIGFEVADFIIDYSGKIGLILTLTFTGLIIIVIHWKIFPEFLKFPISKRKLKQKIKYLMRRLVLKQNLKKEI